MASSQRQGSRGHRAPRKPSQQTVGYYVKVGPSQSSGSPLDQGQEACAPSNHVDSVNSHYRVEPDTAESSIVVSDDGDYQVDSCHGRVLGLARARIRATFYPKFENEKSDQEIRMRMIDVVHSGKGVLEVSLKHSGSLFMYSGKCAAFAKNSFGNLYTAVGVFVLGKTFEETWGAQAAEKQRDFNAYLEMHRLCVSMELVTAVLGDHGQRPQHDYVVVTAVTDLQNKPQFYSTPEIIAFCRQWRLPTNHVWLFSSRKSATSFFTAYDALCEEGTASVVSKVLDEISDISVHATKSHTEVQGEILEGLVARIVSPLSTERMQKVLKDFPFSHEENVQRGKSLREICAENRDSEQKKVYALLEHVGTDMCSDLSDWSCSRTDPSLFNKFLKATPADQMTARLQEVIHFLRARRMSVRYPCHVKGDHKKENVRFRLTIHVLNDSVFRRYQAEMRRNSQLWPLYRGFFVDIELLPSNVQVSDAATITEVFQNSLVLNSESFADESENLMLKLKFLPYKIRTFLIRNGLSTLFRWGFRKYRDYYLKLLGNWGTSMEKQRHLDELLTEWARYIMEKYKAKALYEQTYLSEAEPFLETYAMRNARNQRLVGFAKALTNIDEFLCTSENEDELVSGSETPETAKQTSVDNKDKGMIVFFPGIPGCGKSAVCKELLKNPGALADGRTLHTLMGDLVKGKYWPQLAKERQKGSSLRITLADKNSPNVEVWQTIESMCQNTNAIGVPVLPDSEGTDSNPFSLDVLSLFIYRVLQRMDHPGNLDKNSSNAGYVLLMFYNLYEGKDRSEFEDELKGRFGCLAKLPVLKQNKPNMPPPVLEVITNGLDLFRQHAAKHGRLDSSKGTFKQEWSSWEMRLRNVLNSHSEYFNAIQVPFEEAVDSLREQLLAITKGDTSIQKSSEAGRMFKRVTYAALVLSGNEVFDVIQKLTLSNSELESYFLGKGVEGILKTHPPHVTLAHTASHGISAVAAYGEFCGVSVLIELTAFLFSCKICAFEVSILSNNRGISSKNTWPHLTVWIAQGTKAKEASLLPGLVHQGKATCLKLERPIVLTGIVEIR